MNDHEVIEWDDSMMLEVTFDQPDTFLSIKETLTRIGIANNKTKSLYQSCHILHKRGKYYIMHFKELHVLDGKYNNLTAEDLTRRSVIAKLLEDWGLLTVIDRDRITTERCSLKIVRFKEKEDWSLIPKYEIGT